jgi:hypothetical protein
MLPELLLCQCREVDVFAPHVRHGSALSSLGSLRKSTQFKLAFFILLFRQSFNAFALFDRFAFRLLFRVCHGDSSTDV